MGLPLDLTRRQIVNRVSGLVEGSIGLTESPAIELETGPQGRVQRGWSIAGVSWSRLPDYRDKLNRRSRIEGRITVRYAYRIQPKQQADAWRETADDIDGLCQALTRESSVRNGLIVQWSSVDQRISASGEWLIFDVSIQAIADSENGIG